MATIEILMDREILVKKQEYSSQKLFDIYSDLMFSNKSKEEIAEDITRILDILQDKNHVW